MTDHEYHDRQNLEIFCWPEMMEVFQKLAEIVMISPANISRQLRGEIFTAYSAEDDRLFRLNVTGYSAGFAL
jgi:hypothetical protein